VSPNNGVPVKQAPIDWPRLLVPVVRTAFDRSRNRRRPCPYAISIGKANETAATTLFAILFLVFPVLGFWNIRQHREWMIRAFGVALGIAITRPIVGAFFVAGRLSPHEFFGLHSGVASVSLCWARTCGFSTFG
jgi:hypothetical protein